MRQRALWRLIAGVVLLVPLALGLGAGWRSGGQRGQCSLQLANCNRCIASCGIDSDCTESWKSPEATEKMVLKHFDMQLPRCPAGGTVSIVYDRKAPNRWLPCVVCSLKGSHSHEDPHPDP